MPFLLNGDKKYYLLVTRIFEYFACSIYADNEMKYVMDFLCNFNFREFL